MDNTKQTSNDQDTVPNVQEANNGSPTDEARFNPTLPDAEDEIMGKLRGDKIGETVYSERFVLATLLKLKEIEQPLSENEQLEKELESLWDMTTEKDVVMLLLQLDVFDVFAQCIIKYRNDDRLIEILVGIMGNMCTVADEACEKLSEKNDTVEILLKLIHSDSSETLIQLMRLVAMVFRNNEAAAVWCSMINEQADFLGGFCFILNSSTNETLLTHAFEALIAVLEKCMLFDQMKEEADAKKTVPDKRNYSFLKSYLNTKLVTATFEAFETMHTNYSTKTNTENDDDDFLAAESHGVTEECRKAILMFLQVHAVLLTFAPENCDDNYESLLLEYLNVMFKSIAALEHLPTHAYYLYEVFGNFNDIFEARDNMHEEHTVYGVIQLRDRLKHDMGSLKSAAEFQSDESFKELEETCSELCDFADDLLKTLLKRCQLELLNSVFQRCKLDVASRVFQHFGLESENLNIENLHEYCAQLEKNLCFAKD